nr:hypothetical protein Q903MT_gene6412 [Picea sitchensis]
MFVYELEIVGVSSSFCIAEICPSASLTNSHLARGSLLALFGGLARVTMRATLRSTAFPPTHRLEFLSRQRHSPQTLSFIKESSLILAFFSVRR